jgi:hypothetical protein
MLGQSQWYSGGGQVMADALGTRMPLNATPASAPKKMRTARRRGIGCAISRAR